MNDSNESENRKSVEHQRLEHIPKNSFNSGKPFNIIYPKQQNNDQPEKIKENSQKYEMIIVPQIRT